MNEVKSPKKPLIYYYMIVVLLVLLFNLLAMPWLAEHQIKEVDYNTFVSMTEKNEIGQVEIQQQSNRILFTSTDGKTIYKTAIVPDDGLVQRLLDAGISTTGEEIEQTSLLTDILGWVLPLVIFIAIGQIISRSLMKKMGGSDSLMFVELIEMTAEKYDLDVKLQSIGKYMLKAPMDTMSDVVTMFCKIYQYGNDIVNQ